MAIQMRRGNAVDFDPSKMVPGEWAVSQDNQKVYMCFSQGNVIEMGTASAVLDAEAWARGTKGGVPVPISDPAYHNNSKYYSEQADTIGQQKVDEAESYADASGTSAIASENQALKSEGYAIGEQDGVPVVSGDYYHNNAKYYSEQADVLGQAQAENGEAWAKGTRNGTDVPSTDPAYHNNAKYYSEQADALGGAQVENSEAYATGTRSGVPVPSTDPAYHNNSKYYSEQAESVVQGKVEDAEAWAVGQRNGRDVPPADETYHNNSKYYAEKAEEYKDEAAAIVGIGIATTTTAGIVKPDGSTISVDNDGTIHSRGDANNVWKGMGILGAKNLLPNIAQTTTISYATFTVNPDKSVTINGGNAESEPIYIVLNNIPLEGTYILSTGIIEIENPSRYLSLSVYGVEGSTKTLIDTVYWGEKTIEFTNDYDSYEFRLSLKENEDVQDVTFYPMLRLVYDTDDTYVPYVKTNKELTEGGSVSSWNDLTGKPFNSVDTTGALDITNNVLSVQNKIAASGGTDDSVVTTGDKYNWDSKLNEVRVYDVGTASASTSRYQTLRWVKNGTITQLNDVINGTRYMETSSYSTDSQGRRTFNFTGGHIYASAVFDFYANVYGVVPEEVSAEIGSLTVTFPASALVSTCRVYIK